MNENIKQHLVSSLKKSGMRMDGRKSDEFRKVAIEYDVSGTAEGSARVTIGDSEVVAGVKLTVGSPFPDRPEEGAIMVNAELLPLSSPRFDPGPPGIKAIELSRVVDRGIRESKAIDLKSLCIKKGEKVWIVSIDICMINSDGNLIDAAALAAVAALQHACFPTYENDELDYKKPTKKKLDMKKVPVAVTVFKMGEHLLFDPVPEEEDACDARLTVTATQDGTISALQKGGESSLSIDEIDTMVGMALKQSKNLRKLLK